jgi:hypothetical protein
MPWWAPIVGGAASALIGGLFGKSESDYKPPQDPAQAWLGKYGPETWDYLKDRGTDLIENPYGLGEGKRAMTGTARNVTSSAYEAARRNISSNRAMTGLSPGGGTNTRQEYYAGQAYGEDLGRRLTDIELADVGAQEAQRIRGENMLMSITQKDPRYAQISSQNYWNAINASERDQQMWGNLVGGTTNSVLNAYYMEQWLQMQQNQPTTGQTPPINPGGPPMPGQWQGTIQPETTAWPGQSSNTPPPNNPYPPLP